MSKYNSVLGVMVIHGGDHDGDYVNVIVEIPLPLPMRIAYNDVYFRQYPINKYISQDSDGHEGETEIFLLPEDLRWLGRYDERPMFVYVPGGGENEV